MPNPIVNITNSQQYELIITDGNCFDTLNQLVVVDSININTSDDTTFCKDPILLSANTSGNINSILWSDDSNFSNIISTTDTFLTNTPGAFYIFVSNDNCFDLDSINVLNDNISIELSGITEICTGDSVFIKVDDLNSLDPIISYDWNSDFNMIFSSDSSNFISYPTYNSYYSVKATNIFGCYILDSILVNVSNYPVLDSIWANDTIIYKGETTQLNVETNSNILWSTNENMSTISVSPDSSTKYYIIIYNNYCEVEDSIYIKVKDVFCDKRKIFIPTAFSPNGDLINDNYKIKDDDGIITEFKIEIFNRFGQKVYTSEDVNNSWDGYFNGELLSPQVFDYYLKVKCIGEKYLFEKGNITLIR